MKKISRVKELFKESSKASLTTYLIIRFLVVICIIIEAFKGNFENVFLCVLALILFLLPIFIEKTFKIELPSILEIMIMLFIFAATILGEINNFYGHFANFDDILHTINGFLAASVGFSLVYLLNNNIESFNLSPIFVCLVAFCFSMTIGVIWEFYEYGMDNFFHKDMQKDEIIAKVNTVTFDPLEDNNVISYDAKTTLVEDKDKSTIEIDGVLDIGLHDTMHDLLVNFLGAACYSLFGFLYIINKSKTNIAEKFLIKKKISA